MSNHEPRMVPFIKGNGSPLLSKKQDRNGQCSCGSGKKAKKCCGCETRWRHSRVDEDFIRRQKEEEAEKDIAPYQQKDFSKFNEDELLLEKADNNQDEFIS